MTPAHNRVPTGFVEHSHPVRGTLDRVARPTPSAPRRPVQGDTLQSAVDDLRASLDQLAEASSAANDLPAPER